MYVQNIHNMPKIFWGAWPLTILERPNCSKVLVPLSKLSVSKNVWFRNARLGPLDFIHSEMLKMGMGGSGPSGKQPLGLLFQGLDPPRSNQGVWKIWVPQVLFGDQYLHVQSQTSAWNLSCPIIQEVFAEILPVNDITYLMRIPGLNYTNQIFGKKMVKSLVSSLRFLRFLFTSSYIWHVLKQSPELLEVPKTRGNGSFSSIVYLKKIMICHSKLLNITRG